MENLKNGIIRCIVKTEEVVGLYRRQNYFLANLLEQEVLDLFTKILGELCLCGQMDEKAVNQLLAPALEAKQNKDYVLLADLYELQCLPFLTQLQVQVQEEATHYLEMNLAAMGDAALKEQLKELFAHSEKGICEIEETSVGEKTLLMRKGGQAWYLHSNNNPWREASIFADEYYSSEHNQYIVLGMGLGYHVEQLLLKNPYNQITVFEPEAEVFRAAFSNRDLTKIISSGQVQLVFDPEMNLIASKIKDFDGVFAIHAPSMRNIDNQKIKEKFEEYFMQLSSVKAQSDWLHQNFNQNVKTIDKVVDELREKWNGKEVILVAGGPSLMGQIEKLKTFRKGRILLAVGTVVKKLIAEGIRPDYMIITDASPIMVRQLEGVDASDIPLLYLSTAFPGVLKLHDGEKFCILQKGFLPAEEYAKKIRANIYETGGSVSTTALDVAIRLAGNKIICFGLDLAYTGAKSHAEGTAAYHEVDVSEYRKVPSVTGDMVPTIKNLDSYRHWIERRIKDEKVRFINISKGAYIAGMENRTELEE